MFSYLCAILIYEIIWIYENQTNIILLYEFKSSSVNKCFIRWVALSFLNSLFWSSTEEYASHLTHPNTKCEILINQTWSLLLSQQYSEGSKWCFVKLVPFPELYYEETLSNDSSQPLDINKANWCPSPPAVPGRVHPLWTCGRSSAQQLCLAPKRIVSGT